MPTWVGVTVFWTAMLTIIKVPTLRVHRVIAAKPALRTRKTDALAPGRGNGLRFNLPTNAGCRDRVQRQLWTAPVPGCGSQPVAER